MYGNRVMVSRNSQLVEASAVTANRALVSDASGVPVHSSVRLQNCHISAALVVHSDTDQQYHRRARCMPFLVCHLLCDLCLALFLVVASVVVEQDNTMASHPRMQIACMRHQ